MKKLLSALLALVLVSVCAFAMADAGSEPDWTAYDAMVAQIKAETDFAKREALLHQAEDMLMETYAVLPIYYYNDLFMQRSTIEGAYANTYGYKFFLYATNGDATSLRINMSSEPDFVDPALNSSVDGASLAANSFAGLYTYNAEGAVVEELAASTEVSEDGLTYVVTMKDGLKFSDGSDLTAKDVEWSWKRAAATETAADYGYMFSGFKGYPDDMAITASEDGKTLTFELEAPCAYMYDLMAFPTFYVLKAECVENAEGYRDADGNVIKPGAWALEAGFVTSGAYTLTEWKHNESMTYTKNPNYWNAENVKLENLEFMLSADDTAIYAAYQAGDVDYIDSVPTDLIASLNGIDPEFHIIDNLGTYYIGFNVKSSLFDGKTVEQANAMREAFSKLIDREYIIETVGQCGQMLATSYIPAGMLDGNGGIFKQNDADYTYPCPETCGYYDGEVDVEGAIELLTFAGFEFDANGMLSAATPLSFEYLTNESSGHIAIAECIQQDLAAVGISMTIRSMDWNVFLEERKNGNFDIAREGWLADFNDPINMIEMFETNSGNNDMQFGR